MTGADAPARDGKTRTAGLQPGLIRLIAAAFTVGVGLVVLWQAGVLFQSEAEVAAPGVALQAPDAGITTPPVEGFSVGLGEGNLAPDFEFSSFEGARMKLSDFRGRPVLVNFWASWCIPCRAEMPDIEELQRRYEPQGFAVIAVNMGETYRTATRFLDKIQVRLTAFGYDPGSEIARSYAVQGLPTSYFIDARGIVVKVVAGPLTKNLIEFGAQAAILGYRAP